MKRSVTKYVGVYERKSDSRLHKGKPDVCFDISYKAEGKKTWEKVGWESEGYTAKLASQIRAERLRDIRFGNELPRQKRKAPLFKDLATKYLAWAAENKTRKGRDDRYLYKNHLAPRFDNKRLNDISTFDLERLKASLAKRGLSPASIKHCLVLFRQMVNKGILWGMYSGENPVKGVKMPTIQNQRQRFLSHEEADLLLAELARTSQQLHDMALLSLHCGLRAGEIFDLKGQDLNFENGLINVANPKNKETREAFMTETVKEMLLRRLPDNSNEYVFKDHRHGRKINTISKSFRKVIDGLGFNKRVDDPRQRITFHSLRHTFASWLAIQGESQLTIKELLGHKSLAMTERYAHLIPDHKKRAVIDLEKSFNMKRKETNAELAEDN